VLIDRIAAKVRRNIETGCIEWTGSTTGRYGQIKHRGRNRAVHRVLYEAIKGPVPPGQELDHTCRNPLCLFWDHLEPVSHRENVRRSDAGKATGALQQAKTACPAGHPYTGDNVITSAGYRQCRTCRREQARRAYQRRQAKHAVAVAA
jgi:hypothetical protein